MAGLAAGVAPALAPVPLQFGGGGILYWALIFFVLAIVAWVLGARGIAGLTMEVARILVLIFIVLAIISLILQFLG